MKRTKTISKNFYDDEILFKDENGDIHLKEGVHRLNYPILTDEHNTQINHLDLAVRKWENFKQRNRNWDNE